MTNTLQLRSQRGPGHREERRAQTPRVFPAAAGRGPGGALARRQSAPPHLFLTLCEARAVEGAKSWQAAARLS